MEGFEREQGKKEQLKSPFILDLDEGEIGLSLLGQSIESIIPELIKIFSIINYIHKKDITSVPEAKKIAEDLFKEFNVAKFNYNDVFTDKVVNKLVKSTLTEIMQIKFNQVSLGITNSSTVESVMKEWKQATTENPQKKEQRELKAKENAREKQQILDSMILDLDKLDFSKLENVIDWLREYNKHIIRGVDIHEDTLFEAFKKNGYSPDKNDKIQFMLGETLKDKRRFGEALIGFMLANLGLFERGSEMEKLISDWKQSYS